MPRPIITTVLTPRVVPITNYAKPRGATDFLWAADKQPWEVTFFPWQFTSEWIATVFTPRTEISTEYDTTRGDIPLWSTWNLPWEVTFFPWQYEFMTDSVYTRPRFNNRVQDLTKNFVLDLSWNEVRWIWGKKVNKINTFYT